MSPITVIDGRHQDRTRRAREGQRCGAETCRRSGRPRASGAQRAVSGRSTKPSFDQGSFDSEPWFWPRIDSRKLKSLLPASDVSRTCEQAKNQSNDFSLFYKLWRRKRFQHPRLTPPSGPTRRHRAARKFAQHARPHRYTRYIGQTPFEKEAFRRKLSLLFFPRARGSGRTRGYIYIQGKTASVDRLYPGESFYPERTSPPAPVCRAFRRHARVPPRLAGSSFPQARACHLILLQAVGLRT